MSKEYENQDPIKLAEAAEKDLNSAASKTGTGGSDSTNESGIDESATNKFPGADVKTGPEITGREIPEGGNNPNTGKPFKADAFEGEGGPEDKAKQMEEDRGGDDAIRGNIRQGGETIRPSG